MHQTRATEYKIPKHGRPPDLAHIFVRQPPAECGQESSLDKRGHEISLAESGQAIYLADWRTPIYKNIRLLTGTIF